MTLAPTSEVTNSFATALLGIATTELMDRPIGARLPEARIPEGLDQAMFSAPSHTPQDDVARIRAATAQLACLPATIKYDIKLSRRVDVLAFQLNTTEARKRDLNAVVRGKPYKDHAVSACNRSSVRLVPRNTFVIPIERVLVAWGETLDDHIARHLSVSDDRLHAEAQVRLEVVFVPQDAAKGVHFSFDAPYRPTAAGRKASQQLDSKPEISAEDEKDPFCIMVVGARGRPTLLGGTPSSLEVCNALPDTFDLHNAKPMRMLGVCTVCKAEHNVPPTSVPFEKFSNRMPLGLECAFCEPGTKLEACVSGDRMRELLMMVHVPGTLEEAEKKPKRKRARSNVAVSVTWAPGEPAGAPPSEPSAAAAGEPSGAPPPEPSGAPPGQPSSGRSASARCAKVKSNPTLFTQAGRRISHMRMTQDAAVRAQLPHFTPLPSQKMRVDGSRKVEIVAQILFGIAGAEPSDGDFRAADAYIKSIGTRLAHDERYCLCPGAMPFLARRKVSRATSTA